MTLTDYSTWQLVKEMTIARMKARYRQTFAGAVWVVFNPVAIYLVHAFVFKSVINIPIENYYIFLLSGILPWSFIQLSIDMTVNIFVSSKDVLLSFKLNPIVFLFTQVLENFINFIVAFTLLLFIIAFSHQLHLNQILRLVPPLILLILGVNFICLTLATLQVFLRDTQFIARFVNGMMYLLTPIFYSKDLIPEKYQFILTLNPYHLLIDPFRYCLWKNDITAYTQSLSLQFICVMILGTIAITQWKDKVHDIYLRL